jgi:hypothetical protein
VSGLGVVHKLVHQRPLARVAHQVLRVRASEGGAFGYDGADLDTRTFSSIWRQKRSGERCDRGETLTAKCFGNPLIPLPSPSSRR